MNTDKDLMDKKLSNICVYQGAFPTDEHRLGKTMNTDKDLMDKKLSNICVYQGAFPTDEHK